MAKKLLELAVEIVQTQVSTNKMSAEEIEAALMRVYNALYQMQRAEEEGKTLDLYGRAEEGMLGRAAPEEVDPRSSIQEDKVVCLECGAEFRQLTANHLKTHQLTPREYKKKWGFPLKQPLAARSLTKLRSRAAKKRGLPQKLQQYLDDQRQKKEGTTAQEAAETKSPQRRTSRRTSES